MSAFSRARSLNGSLERAGSKAGSRGRAPGKSSVNRFIRLARYSRRVDASAHPTALEESARLAALADLAILDTESEREFDAVTRVAASVLGVSSAAVSLIDRDRQWFKSRHGIDFTQTPRDIAFCDQVVARRDPLVVPDALEDEAFCNNPLVVAEPRIRFYAGVPLFLKSGHCIGSLCVLDDRPHHNFGDAELQFLWELGSIVEELIEARKARSRADIAAEVVASTPDAVVATNRAAQIVFWNEAAERMFGWPLDQALGQDITLIIPDWFRDDLSDRVEAAVANGPTHWASKFVELEAWTKGGTNFPIELSPAAWGDDDHGGYAAVVRDITKRRALQADRDASKKFLDAVVTNLPSMLFVKDSQTHRYLLLNKKAEELVGRSAESMIGRHDAELFPSRGAAFKQNDARAVASGKPEQAESTFERDDGSMVDIRTTRVLVDGPDRPGQYLLGLSEDVTEIRLSESERLKLARYDTLTGLLNRASFLEQVDKLIADGVRFAILNVDLDRFKSVNDQFGHVVGDEVLKLVGQRIGMLADEETHVSRIGGDEFVCVLTGQALRKRARCISESLMAGVSAPITVGGITAHIGASIGVVVYPDDGDSLETLRQHADLAMYRSKQDGRGEPCFFDDAMDAAERDRRKLETNLRTAIEEDTIDVAFQPIVDASTGEVIGCEALARWTEADRGPVPPDVFISLAENCGLIEMLGEQVLRRACREAQSWPEHIKIAVNLSPRQFFSGRLVDTVLAVLADTGLAADRLQLEVTENLVIQNAEEAFSQLALLKQNGIQISIDDFGIGYSSLSYFQTFPFDKVKIDKSFIGEVEDSRAAKAIVTAVVGLGEQLSMNVVAEGVETIAQQKLLRKLGVTHLQGYLYSEPLTSEQVTSYLSQQVASPVARGLFELV
ncbi:EAL domain-containing protein [Erythrobacter sp. 3-20A1M]|nr:EAL domain-containing protein [Erythrobacter sp. 3-20A1M]